MTWGGIQCHPGVPASRRRRGGRHLRRVWSRADAAIPRSEDMGDGRRPWSRRDRRPGRPRERARARARRADRARALAGARGRAGDVDRGVQGQPGWMHAGAARGRQPRPARGRPGTRAGVRDRHRLRGSRNHARLHPPPGTTKADLATLIRGRARGGGRADRGPAVSAGAGGPSGTARPTVEMPAAGLRLHVKSAGSALRAAAKRAALGPSDTPASSPQRHSRRHCPF